MRLTTGFVLWVVAAAAATAVGLAAVAAIGTDIFGAGRDPLSRSEVDELLASRTQSPPVSTTVPSSSAPASTTPTTPTPTTTATPPAEQPTVTEGGTVIARCTADGLVEVLSATPAQGYAVDREDHVEDHPSVRFSSGHRRVEVRLRCVHGTPNAEIKVDD
ncbi:hypothetical protein [Actinophytocola sp.]|uniref:hypothetical protein n=1 Tax=Actinophytocola sp. TaxID=1872138 RepID=UPI00389AD374